MRMALNNLRAILFAMGAAACLRVFSLLKPAGSSPPFSTRCRDGRLYRAAGLSHVYAGACALIVFVAATFVPQPVSAATIPTYAASWSTCTAAAAHYNAQSSGYNCQDMGLNKANGACYVGLYTPQGSLFQSWQYDCNTTPPSNPCTANVPPDTGEYSGKILSAYGFCQKNVPTGRGDGSTTSCSLSFTPLSPPTQNQWGNWHTYGTLAATGNICDGTSTSANAWKDQSGNAPQPTPPAVSDAPPVSPAPKTCGGGSCFDNANDQYCATAGGAQFCVSGNTARTSPGGCASSGDSTLCAGSPTAPSPSPSNIPDPADSLRNSDTYTQADKTTGANQTVQVNTFTNVGGTPSTSGKAGNDTGPASSSSTGSSSCTAGQLCNDQYIGAACGNDPSVAGDPVVGAIAVDIHRIRCSNSLSASDFDGADRTLGDQTTSPDSVFTQSTGSGSGDPTSVLDQSGFLGGGRQCPGIPEVSFQGVPYFTDKGVCQVFGMWAGYILVMGYALGVIILYRGRAR